MMRGPTTFSGLHGETATYEFRPEYDARDFVVMQGLIDDAAMRGIIAMRFIHDDCVTVRITNGDAR